MTKTKIEMLEKEIVGVNKTDAEKLISAICGYGYRVTEEDGVSYIVTSDFRTDRINVKIKNGIVIDAQIG